MLYHWATLPGMESSNYRMSSTHGSHFFTLNQVLTSTKAQGEDLEWFSMSWSKFNLTSPWRPLAIPKEKERFPRRVMTKIWYETAVNIRWIWDWNFALIWKKSPCSTRLNLSQLKKNFINSEFQYLHFMCKQFRAMKVRHLYCNYEWVKRNFGRHVYAQFRIVGRIWTCAGKSQQISSLSP